MISSRSKKFSMMPFLFQMIGGRSVPWIAQVSTALRPTVTVETLICWSSARLSCTTSVGIRVRREMTGVVETELIPERQIRDGSENKSFRKKLEDGGRRTEKRWQRTSQIRMSVLM